MKKRGWLTFLSFLVLGCAQINPLTGGDNDIYAPAIDSVKSFPANGQVNFSGDEVRLKFDEYITLVKPSENILIIPAPAVPPVIQAHNKTLRIHFLTPLEDSTTYTINFNHAIADITEKNDSVFQYVFSTGSYIDSLKLTGTVKDAYTNLALDGFIVALYPVSDEIMFDSVPYLRKPTYITETDKSGNFKLNYLKEGDYWAFALEDKNKNLKLNAGERFGFLSQEYIEVSSIVDPVEFRVFKPEDTTITIDHVNFVDPGKLEVIFQGTPVDFEISTSCELLSEATGEPDSLVWWLAIPPVPKMQFITSFNNQVDTLRPIYKSNPAQDRKLTWSNNLVSGKLLPDQLLEITFSEPLDTIGLGQGVFLILSDSIRRNAHVEVRNLRTLVITDLPNELFTVDIDSGAIKSVYGLTNQLAISVTGENHPGSYFGSMVVNTDTVFNETVWVYLLNDKGKILDTVAYDKVLKFEKLIPGNYQLMAVFDSNSDGRWTAGSLPERKLPEKVIYFNGTIEVKSKWMKEVDWVLSTYEF